MADKMKREVLIISESVARSWAIDASTYSLFVALIGTGWVLDSAAMQWAGAIVGFIAILTRATGYHKSRTFTIADARAELDRLEALQ